MKKPKQSPSHLPGPWEVGEASAEGGPGVRFSIRGPDVEMPDTGLWHVADVMGGPETDGLECDEANARLIAASPDLLAACESVAVYSTVLGGTIKAALHELVRDAIVKARGK